MDLDFINKIISHKKGGIYIKPENRGKFTEYCGGKVTTECIQKGKNSPDPKIRKRATFAANARKWKHQEGGTIDQRNWDIFKGINNYKNFQAKLDSIMNSEIQNALKKSKEEGTGLNYRISYTAQSPINPMDTMSLPVLKNYNSWLHKQVNSLQKPQFKTSPIYE